MYKNVCIKMCNVYKNMYYQKHKEKLQKEASETYQNLSEEKNRKLSI